MCETPGTVLKVLGKKIITIFYFLTLVSMRRDLHLSIVTCGETILVTQAKPGNKSELSVLINHPHRFLPVPHHDDSSVLETEEINYLDTELDILERCRSNISQHRQTHPASCAWYLDCSVTPDAVMLTFFTSFLQECPYPQLFSDVTWHCEDFGKVDCKKRPEPKSPCEYRSNQCQESSHCAPCWVQYASCVGRPEGLNPVSGTVWQPSFVECHREGTVFQGSCTSGSVFSPVTRACETPLNIPTLQGGWKPSCQGRRDGAYPDHRGRCETYFLCQGQLFRGLHRCSRGRKDARHASLVFNPFSSACEPIDKVPYPCGNRDLDHGRGDNEQFKRYFPVSNVTEDIDLTRQLTKESPSYGIYYQVKSTNVCLSKADGNYMDVFGRCSHYFTCKRGYTVAFQVCPTGLFNVAKRQCDDNTGAVARLPRPCGEMDNLCFDLPDGTYEMSELLRCSIEVHCERGFVIAMKSICE